MYEELRVSKEELRDFFEWIEDILKTERNEQEIDNSKVENEKKIKVICREYKKRILSRRILLGILLLYTKFYDSVN